MRIFIILATFLISSALNAQIVDKNYIDRWLKASDSSAQIDAVVVYRVDQKEFYSYDTTTLNNELRKITIDRIASIVYSDAKKSGNTPGKGTIDITTLKSQSLKELESAMREAEKSFKDKYNSFSQHIYSNAKDPVLIIDNELIHYAQVREELKKINLNDVFAIVVTTNFPVPYIYFGQNSKNGMVRIWTKKMFSK